MSILQGILESEFMMEAARLSTPERRRRLRLCSDDRVYALGAQIEAGKWHLVKTVEGEKMLMVVAVYHEAAGISVLAADGRMFAEKDVLGYVGMIIKPVPKDNVNAAFDPRTRSVTE